MTDYAKKPSSKGGLVYSTDGGRMCPGCRLAIAQCACKARLVSAPAGDVRVSLQTKGRAGKSVTQVHGLALDAAALALLGKQLRTACGCGGTVKEGVIDIQGDHGDLVIATLAKLGHRAKRTGL